MTTEELYLPVDFKPPRDSHAGAMILNIGMFESELRQAFHIVCDVVPGATMVTQTLCLLRDKQSADVLANQIMHLFNIQTVNITGDALWEFARWEVTE